MIGDLVRPRYTDPFKPTLLSSESLKISDEQKQYIRWILDRACSDSRFAQKAYDAISVVLTGGSVKVPVVAALTPSSVVLGQPSFDIHVIGTGFVQGSLIIFNGFEEPTTHVSDTELTTGVNMPLWLAPAIVPISVMSPDGVTSNSMMFEFKSSARVASTAKEEQKLVDKPKDPTHISGIHSTKEFKEESAKEKK